MNDTIIQDSTLTSLSSSSILTNWWMWIALAELLIILFLLLNKKKNTKTDQRILDAKEGEVDFGNILNSAFNAPQLYDILKKKYHPDRFVLDEEKNKIADQIFQEITKNKNNLKRLKELQIEAENKLKK